MNQPQQTNKMTITHIKYNRVLNVIQTVGAFTTVSTKKICELENVILNLESFAITLDNNKIKKTIKKIEAQGFTVELDESFGFEWESKMYCNI
tara:strand:- start:3122 stop:3400 length:279 start_codon:yes stop_codon:yes gene_type:complete